MARHGRSKSTSLARHRLLLCMGMLLASKYPTVTVFFYGQIRPNKPPNDRIVLLCTSDSLPSRLTRQQSCQRPKMVREIAETCTGSLSVHAQPVQYRPYISNPTLWLSDYKIGAQYDTSNSRLEGRFQAISCLWRCISM